MAWSAFDIRNFDLEADATATGWVEVAGEEGALQVDGLLDHEMSALFVEIGEAVFGPGIKDGEAEDFGVEAQAAVYVGAVEFGTRRGSGIGQRYYSRWQDAWAAAWRDGQRVGVEGDPQAEARGMVGR